MCTGPADVAVGGTQSQQVCEDSLLAGAVHTKAVWDRRPGPSGFGGMRQGECQEAWPVSSVDWEAGCWGQARQGHGSK